MVRTSSKIIVGIDASRIRSGGARVHLIGIIENLDVTEHSICQVHLWSYRELLNTLPERPWLHKHCPPALERSLLSQLLWQRNDLATEARALKCNIMFSASASTLSQFSPMVVLSQDLLSYEKGAMRDFGFGRARLRLLAILFLQNSAFRRSEGVIFLTKYAGQLIQTSCGRLKQVAYVPHGVGDTFRRVAKNRPWPANGDPIVCTYVSNAEMYKHQWQVVEAIALLRNKNYNLKLVLVGGGHGRAQNLLDNSILNFDPNKEFVTQIEFVSQNELTKFLASSDIFIFASSCENLPITLLEGMAAGLPIACSNRGPMPEVLQDAGTLFDPQDPESIANAVEKLIIDPDLRHSVASRATQLADDYTWNKCSRETFQFIKKFMIISNTLSMNKYNICSNCIMDTSDPNIGFDDKNWCNYCNNFKLSIADNWQRDIQSLLALNKMADAIRTDSKGRDFDCIIGLSGGLDSSYATYVAKEKMGLRPLLIHVDAGWNTDQAVGNIEKLVDGLGLDLYTEVVNWDEMRRLQVAFLRSGIPDLDLVQDAAFFSGLYKFARQHGIKHVITGSNFSTECCREPEEWGGYLGIDKRLFGDIFQQFGEGKLDSFPLMDILVYKLWYQKVLGMKVHHPLNLVPFVKKDAEDELERLFGWQRFQHKHHESRFTRFYEDYWLPRRFGYEKRRAHFSSLIMTGQMTREEALDRISRPEMDEHFLQQEFEYVAHKLGLTVTELQQLFNCPRKTYRDYKNKRWLIGFGANALRWLGLEKRYFR